MKNKEIARQKIIELEKERQAEIINKAEESKVEIIKEIIQKKSKELNTKKKTIIRRNEKTKNFVFVYFLLTYFDICFFHIFYLYFFLIQIILCIYF